jgi:predicted nucleotidyltransferase
LDLASEYEEIKQRIELNFNLGNDEAEIKKSIALIQTYINNNSDQWGFVSYENTSEVVNGADLVLEKARGALERNKTTHAVKLALCIIRAMVDLFEKADDSDGVIGGTIEESFAFIAEIIEDEALSPARKEEIFDQLITEAANQRYDDWTDWRLDLLGKCAELTDNRLLRNKLEHHLVAMVENEKGDSWSVKNVHPDKVILFGSYANGNPGEDSDLDLLVIKDMPQKRIQRGCEIRKYLRGAGGRTNNPPVNGYLI